MVTPKKSERQNKSPIYLLLDGQEKHDLSQRWLEPRFLANYKRIHVKVTSLQKFLSAIRENGESPRIDFMQIYTHGCEDRLRFLDGTSLTIEDIKKGILSGFDRYFNRTGISNCFIHACCVAKPIQGSFAEKFFKVLRINGEAPETTIRFGPDLDHKLRAVPEFAKEYEDIMNESMSLRYFEYANS